MKYPRHTFTAVLALLLVVAATASSFAAIDTTDGSVDTQIAAEFSPADEHGRYVYLIQFAEPGLLARHRQQRSVGERERFNAAAPAMRSAQAELQVLQQQHIQTMAGAVGRALDVSHHYLVSYSGIATRLTPAEAAAVQRLPGVVAVERDRVYQLDTYRGPEFIGAGAIWNGSAVPGNNALLGEEMVAAILDTGILVNHPSFANDTVNCSHGVGGVPDKLLSALDCATTDASGMCNGPDASDGHSHGSHVSGTVAGNFLDDTSSPPPAVDISGVAPCAHVRSYKVCPSSCPSADIQAGMDSVLLHGDVDVMNFSISGGTSPWADNDRRKLDLVDAGILVAASAGNTSTNIPDPVGNVGHRGPWVTTVANSSHDGLLGNPLSVDNGPQNVASLQGTGPAMGSDFSAPLRWAGDVDPGNEEGCLAFPANAFSGEAALIMRANCNFSVKVDNAVAAGATFVVMINHNVGQAPTIMGGLEGTSVSSVMVANADGLDIIAALAGGTEQVTVLAEPDAYIIPALGGILASGSLIGPTPSPLQDLQKPDITAPGTSIYAAGTPASGYTLMSGTSMASPHIAGAAVLVKQAQPDWSPVEVKSALMMTASKIGRKADATTPWDADDVGSGRADLSKAALAGLVMHETFQNFLDADPAIGGDVRSLNLPALRNMDCSPSCSFERTVRNTLSVATSWTVSHSFFTGEFGVDVSPSSFDFIGDPNETRTLVITITPDDDQSDAIHFGELVFTEAGSESPDLHWTLAMTGKESLNPPAITVDPAALTASQQPDQTSVQTLTIGNNGDMDLDWEIGQSEAIASSGSFLIHDQGPFITSTGDGPGGSDVSLLQNSTLALTSLGLSTVLSGGGPHFRTADVFTVTGSFPQQIDQLRFFAYQAGSGTTSTFTGVNYRIWDGPPDDPASTVVFGDTTTNRIVDTAWTNSYRYSETATGTSRPIMSIDAEGGFSLDPGTYWLDWQLAGSLASGPWQPPITIIGETTTGSAKRLTSAGWEDFTDGGTGTPQGAPFQLWNTTACESYTNIPWLSVNPASGTIAAGDSDPVTISLDSSGLAGGNYAATICIESNDPSNPVWAVPVALEVIESPAISVDPLSISASQDAELVTDHDIEISNLGPVELVWNIEQSEVLAGSGLFLFHDQGPLITSTGDGPGGSDVSLLQNSTLGLTSLGLSTVLSGGGPHFRTADVFTVTGAIPWPIERLRFFAYQAGSGTTSTFTGVNYRIWDGPPDDPASTVVFGDTTTNRIVDTAWINSYRYSETATGTTRPIMSIDAEGGFSLDPGTYWLDWQLAGSLGSGPWQPPVTIIGETSTGSAKRLTSAGWEDFTDGGTGTPQGAPFQLWGASGCDSYTNIPWLSVNPTSGTTPASSSDTVTVSLDSSGLVGGSYSATICIESNDLNNPVWPVPVTLEVNDVAADVSLEDLVQTYTGGPLEVTVVTDPPGLAVEVTYNGSATPPTDAGSYAVEATVTEPGFSGSASDTFMIESAAADVNLVDLIQTFSGDPLEVTVITDPAGLNVVVTYDGFATAPTDAGSYAVVATVDEQNHVGSASDTFVIEPATASILFDDLQQNFTGNPLEPTITTDPAGLNVIVTYDSSPTAPSAVGQYLVEVEVDEQNWSGSDSATFEILEALLDKIFQDRFEGNGD